MPLPKIATPTYELELPSSGETIQYRPFLVKEEKLLVIALESEDNKTEVREHKSSSPIEVTQIDEKSSAEKPKKKGWWSK